MTTTQFGKSLTTALAVLWTAKVHKLRVAILAPTDEQSRIIMRYLLQYVEAHDDFKRGLIDLGTIEKLKTERTKQSLVWADGTSIRVFTVNATTTTGIAAKSVMGFGAQLVIGDEMGLVPNAHFNKIFRMLGGDVENSRLIKIGNPFNKFDNYPNLHHFYRSSIDPTYTVITVDYKQAIAEGRLNEQFIEEARKQMSPLDFKVLYEVEFPELDDEVSIFTAQELSAWHRGVFANAGGNLMAGLDVSGAGEDETILTIASCGFEIDVLEQITIHGKDTKEKSDVVHNILKERGVYTVSVDVVGIGKGVADNLANYDDRTYNVVEYIAGASPEEPLFANAKTELVFLLRKLLISNRIRLSESVDYGKLETEMIQLRERVLADKRKKTEDPADSPDHLDSLLALLYAYQRNPPINISFA
jgi:hypothetical protein